MHLATYVGMLHRAERTLADAFRQVADGHPDEADVVRACSMLAGWSDRHVERLAPAAERYGEQQEAEPDRLHAEALGETRSGAVGLLRDLHDLYLLASFVDVTWSMVGQAAQGARDTELCDVVGTCEHETGRQLRWIRTRMRDAAPQTLLVAP
jgi:hypothetical protein